jgi:GNAT superfamily N-acetyltransferase
MQIVIRAAQAEDLPLLAEMNRRLIADEGSRNPMRLAELESRMRDWLASEWRITLFETASAVIGYALYRLGQDAYFPERPVVNVRHFFIERDRRGRGLGREAFEALARERFPAGCRIELDALTTNAGGLRFWQKLGFEAYAVVLVREA